MTTKIALITGGNRGLGKSSALKLAAEGVDVVITYRRHAEQAQEVVAEIEALGRRAVALPLDVEQCAGFAEFASQLRLVLQARWQRADFDFLE